MKIKDPVLREAYNKAQSEYQRNRYANDPDYKRRKIESNKRWLDKNREKWNTFQRERYRKRKEEKNARME